MSHLSSYMDPSSWNRISDYISASIIYRYLYIFIDINISNKYLCSLEQQSRTIRLTGPGLLTTVVDLYLMEIAMHTLNSESTDVDVCIFPYWTFHPIPHQPPPPSLSDSTPEAVSKRHELKRLYIREAPSRINDDRKDESITDRYHDSTRMYIPTYAIHWWQCSWQKAS